MKLRPNKAQTDSAKHSGNKPANHPRTAAALQPAADPTAGRVDRSERRYEMRPNKVRDDPLKPGSAVLSRRDRRQASAGQRRSYDCTASNTVQALAVTRIKLNPRNSRAHSNKQIRQIANSIVAFGFTNPLLVTEDGELIAGEGRYKAAQLLGLVKVPAIVLAGLSPARQRALAIADNKIAENAGWDRERLAIEIPELAGLLEAEGLDVSILGFEAVEIDQLVTDFEEEATDPEDGIEPKWLKDYAVSKPGDLWVLGPHKLLCGDARSATDIARLMAHCDADMAFLDPPYNLRIGGVGSRGRTKHSEFAMASGEMSSADYMRFLGAGLSAAASVSRDGALHCVCTDWRHIAELMAAAKPVYGDTINIAVWVKSNAGQGSFYRSQHEFIGVFRVGEAPHLNNIELGRHGRSRSNVWHYAGVNSFRAGRMEELRSHPSAKPVALVADAIKDCTRRRDIVLDTFCGSGTTILAAERVGRHARALEIEPRFVDVAIRRWQAFTRRDACHAVSGLSFDEIAAKGSPAGRFGS
jgi:DNA modification methylase